MLRTRFITRLQFLLLQITVNRFTASQEVSTQFRVHPQQKLPGQTKGFIEDLEWVYNAIKGANNKEINKILEKIEQIADNELFFEIGMLISSDSEVPKNQIDETIVVFKNSMKQ